MSIPPGFRVVEVPGIDGMYLLNERALYEAAQPKPIMTDPYADRIDPRRYFGGVGFPVPINANAVMKLSPDPLPFMIDVDPPFSRGEAKAARRTWHKRKRASKWLRKQRAPARDADRGE